MLQCDLLAGPREWVVVAYCIVERDYCAQWFGAARAQYQVALQRPLLADREGAAQNIKNIKTKIGQ